MAKNPFSWLKKAIKWYIKLEWFNIYNISNKGKLEKWQNHTGIQMATRRVGIYRQKFKIILLVSLNKDDTMVLQAEVEAIHLCAEQIRQTCQKCSVAVFWTGKQQH